MSTLPATLPAAPAPRLGAREAVGHALLMTRRNLIKLRTKPGELIGMIMFPVIFVLLFVFVFGGAIAGSTSSYLQFALPGVLAQSVIFGSQATGTSLNTDIATGVFDRFRSLPIARSAPLIGQVTGDVVRIAMGMVITFAFGTLLGFRVHTGPAQALAAFGILLGFAFAFSWVPTLIGVVAKSPTAVQLFSGVLIFPLTFASSVFVPASTMPWFLQPWVKISPISVLSDTVRGLLLGGPVLDSGLKTLAWAVGLVFVFAPLGVRAYIRRT
jgi:ABC transporter DrrB family efflux protein